MHTFPRRIHFMGIGGRGISGVVMMALHAGYEVSGCDRDTTTPYIQELREKGIAVATGHDKTHTKESDLLVVSPALFVQQTLPEEMQQAKKVITWQQFLAQYLQQGKQVICVAGTHGKSTTTAIASLLFEQAGRDPTVMIGATITRWHENYRLGNSHIHITESDEYYDNFQYYHPETIILNNIELDHPDYFKTEEQLFSSYQNHVSHLRGKKQLVINRDDPGNQKLLRQLPKELKESINIYAYSLRTGFPHPHSDGGSIDSDIPGSDNREYTVAHDIVQSPTGTTFMVKNTPFSLPLPGLFNVSNALGVIVTGELYGIPQETIQKSLENFEGIGMRLEKVGEKHDVLFYDDYAHHPTAVRQTLHALRQWYPHNRIIAIVQPDSFSRTHAFLSQYKNAFTYADEVLIAPISPGRDTEDFGLTNRSVAEISAHPRVSAPQSFDEITSYIKTHARPGDVIIAMCGGGGKIHEVIREIAQDSI